MVNVVINLKEEFNAEELVALLLKEQLIASASIDVNNLSYKVENGVLIKELYNVITAKSKALLLTSIIKRVEEKIQGEVFINSTPIVGSNKSFDELVLGHTIKV